uniref:Uncharacterized protein n=1 Tax=Rhizophora mucronata TaxID=61149 RepID=A0A2P2MRL8_RHIMU
MSTTIIQSSFSKKKKNKINVNHTIRWPIISCGEFWPYCFFFFLPYIYSSFCQ